MKQLSVIRGAALSGALILLDATRAVAASGENTPLHLNTPSPSHVSAGGSSLPRTIIALVAVVAAIYGVTWFLRLARKGRSGISGTGLTQLANLPLGSGRSIALVRAGDEVLLVGVAEHGVTALRTYTTAEAIASGIDLPPDDPTLPAMADARGGRLTDTLRRMTVRS